MEPAATVTTGPPLRVLLVEDDEMHAELITRAFEDSPGIELVIARRIDEARSRIEQHAPDMVIADLRLPDGQGIDLCESKGYPIVIMTSQGSEAAAVEAMRAGALDYVVKSDAMFSEMPHLVERTIREWNLRQAHERADRFLHAQYEVASALATSRTLEQACPQILASICQCVDWPVAEFWRIDKEAGVLRRAGLWLRDPSLARLEAEDASVTFARGEGLPGAAWERGHEVSVPDINREPSLHWRRALSELNVKCAYAFPVQTAQAPFGVFTFFSEVQEAPNGDIHRLMSTVSAQLGLFAERQRAEEERQELQRELVERERLAAVGQTAAMLAHEIANPLNSMYVHGQMLVRRMAKCEGLDPKIVEGAERILGENVRLTGLLLDFRTLAQREAVELEPADIRAIAEGVLDMQGPLLEMNSIKIERRLASDLPLIVGDEAKLKQVLLNLVKNAAEAMPSGGTLSVTAIADDQHIIVEIADTGVGLPEGLDVFEPFQSTKPSGTGLGLAVSRQILAAHEGTIGGRPRKGGGTAFRVVLPRQPNKDAGDEPV